MFNYNRKTLLSIRVPFVRKRVYHRIMKDLWDSCTHNGSVFGYTWQKDAGTRMDWRLHEEYAIARLTIRILKFWGNP